MRFISALQFVSGFVAGAIFFSLVASAWTGPSATAPSGNTPAPINVGSVSQTKNGNLGVNGLTVSGNTLLATSTYLNFGGIAGSAGYGIWDNAGLLEFRNSGGSWQSLQQAVQQTVYSLGTSGLTTPYLPAYAAWASQGTGAGAAAIYNDNGSYKTLMIVGNNSAGGNRKVQVWDDFTVSNNLYVNGDIYDAAGSRWVSSIGRGAQFTTTSAVCPNGSFMYGTYSYYVYVGCSGDCVPSSSFQTGLYCQYIN